MFDNVRCELPMPDGRKIVENSYQTQSLWCSMDRFTITVAGRLIYHRCRYEGGPDIEISPGVWIPQYKRVPMEDTDMDYHGDLLIYGTTKDNVMLSYAVRFTHGTVESICPLEALPEIHRTWLLERGCR